MEMDPNDLIPGFDGDNLMEYQSDMFNEDSMYPVNDDAEDVDEDIEPEDIIAIHMHICDPIENLRTLLQERVGAPLPFPITLQHSQVLDPNKNLIEQCVNGEGIVQINAQIIFDEKRINIYDVLQPINDDDASNEYPRQSENDDLDEIKEECESKSVSSENELISSNDETEHDDMIKWVIDVQFKNEQIRLKIPEDPSEWTTAQVKHWLQWAVRQFKLNQIKLNDWNLTGKELCALKFPEFKEKVPSDPLNVFWTHLELLRKCKFVAVIKRPNVISENGQLLNANSNNTNNNNNNNNNNGYHGDDDDDECTARKLFKQTSKSIRLKQPNKQHYKINNSNALAPGVEVYQGNRSGNNGQIQLWQFLLEMLTERQHRFIIQWIGGEGEFKFVDPEKVAQLWGERKNKPTMNYEKLSRALRYYYDGDMISKVHGKRFVYKFVCNLQQLIGYNAQQLSDLVNFP